MPSIAHHAPGRQPAELEPGARLRMIDVDGLAQLQRRSYEHTAAGMATAWPPESAMTADELGAFLSEPSFCVLATVGRSMKPLARPVAFLVSGTTLWVASGAGARLRHLRETGWASAVIMEGQRGPHRGVVMDGPVEVIEAAPDDVLADYSAVHGDAAGWAVAWCALNPQTIYSYR